LNNNDLVIKAEGCLPNQIAGMLNPFTI